MSTSKGTTGGCGILDTLFSEASVLVKAAQRVAALMATDLGIAAPKAKPLLNVALGALQLKASSGEEFVVYRPSKRQSVLLVLCHPSKGKSFCRSLADIWAQELSRAGVAFELLELTGDTNVGLSNETELRAALAKPEGQARTDVAEMQSLVDDSKFLVFIHPIFWFEVPSQLKGFLESVLSSGFAFRKLPSCWTLNRAVDLLAKLPVLPSLLQRYSACGFLRDKSVYITRTQGGPASGLSIFGHGATSLESSMQFCGAHISAVDVIPELDDTSHSTLEDKELPKLRRRIAAHCSSIADSVHKQVALGPSL
jgi:putative NADPH-quinone reductase